MSRPRPWRVALPAALLVLAATAIVAPPTGRESADRPRTAVESSTPAPPTAAAVALRAGDCAAAIAALEPAAGASAPLDEADVIAGLYLEACGEDVDALHRLRPAAPYSGPLADWRLWTIGRSGGEIGDDDAQRALTALAVDHPDSPLAGSALTAAAELALSRDDLDGAEFLVARGRERDLAAANASRLEAIAWAAAGRRDDAAALRRTARRLLVDHPLTAAELEVVEVFRADDGDVVWEALFTPEELMRRARSLLEADLGPSAVATLDRVPEGARDDRWLELRVEALTDARRGAEATVMLASATAATPADEARIEWLRAGAALEAAVARRGRPSSAAERRDRRRSAHRHLRRVVALGTNVDLSRKALRILFTDLADDGQFEAAVDALRALRVLDPGDETGAGYLWRRGWRELERRNHSSAIGYWTELRQLYPDSTAARRALYWSARAHHELGNRDRSQTLLGQVVSSAQRDFYHRHAMERLVASPPVATPPRGPAAALAWPRDPLLARARRLSDLGLDEAARTELELVAERATPRAVRALRAEILARQGRTRQSIVELRRAFPELGTHRQHEAPAAALRLYYPLEYDRMVTEAARRQGLSPHLVFAMIRQESAFDSGAHSHAGARGLMQVMPATGRELAGRLGLAYDRSRLVDPQFSVQLGTTYYRQVLRSLGDEELALAAYNGGPSRIRRLWNRSGDWTEIDRFIESLPLAETRSYVQRIVLLSNSYRDLYSG